VPCDSTGCHLHTKAWRPYVSTCDPHRQVCAAQRPRPSRKATATRTTSSSRRRPHETIGSANSQSPLDVWRLRLRKLAYFLPVVFAAFERVTGSLEARPVPGRLSMRRVARWNSTVILVETQIGDRCMTV